MRDDKGRFLPGNPGSPGRLPRQTEREYLDIMLSACSPSKWRAICRQAVADAIAGDGVARRWLAEYIVGKPPTTIELNAADSALLADVLAVLSERGLSAATLFNAMLQELAVESEEIDNE